MKKWNRLIIFILGIIFICVLLTFVVVKVLLYEHDKGVMVKEPMEVLFENVYVTDQNDGHITFLSGGRENVFEGTAESDCIGICDIRVKDGKILSIITKRETIEGNLLKFGSGIMEIQEGDQIKYYDYAKGFPVYSFLNGKVEQSTTRKLVMGESELTYVVADGKICALLQYKPCTFNNIRVLMKNKGETYYKEEIHVETDGDYSYIANESGDRLTKDCSGKLEVIADTNGYVVVNTLSVEDYVKYVTPSEMISSWNKEALKAQAVCARTYAYSQMRNSTYAAFGANLDNTTAYQAFNNTELTKATNEAADETQFQVLSNDNKLITCYFYSTSAGMTNTMKVWDSENPPYLHEVESIDDNSPLYNWSAELDYTKTDDNELGAIIGINVLERNSGGYITCLKIEYEKGSKTYKSEYKIRSILAQHSNYMKNKSGKMLEGWSLLPSACFEIDDSIDPMHVSITGKGNGHGIGMSQYGAKKMADTGSSYEEILKYYYADVELADIRDLLK